MDEHGRNHLAVELIGTLRAGNNGSTRQRLVVPQKILNEIRLARLTLANQHHHLVVLNLGHVELLEA